MLNNLGLVALLIFAADPVSIDADWLAARQPPYVLDQADTVYRLAADVTVDGTAFVPGAANVVLDGDGHTITYGQSTPVSIVNGGFEDGTLVGWDVSKAPAAVIQRAAVGMWGGQMLAVAGFTTPQSISSDPVAIPTPGREYAGTITAKGSGASLILRVVDSATGKELASKKLNNLLAGEAAVAVFTAGKALKSVRLRVELLPSASGPATVHLDYAAVLPSRDYAVLCFTDSTKWPAQLKTPAVMAAAKQASNFTLRNVTLRQGSGRAMDAAGVYGNLPGLTIENVSSTIVGMDSMHVVAQWASGGVTIRDSVFTSDIDIIGKRREINAALRLARVKGDIRISDNTFIDSPQVAIFVSENSDGRVRISDNQIYSRAIVANPYGILVNGLTDFRVTDNRIVSENSRGISLDSFSGTPSERGEVSGNHVDVSQSPNLEYQKPSSQAATAFRMRNWGVPQRDVYIHDNTFIARTKPGKVAEAIGGRITQDNPNHVADNAGNLIARNTFRAICDTTDPNYRAAALSLSHVDGGTGLRIEDNDLQSNSISLRIGDSDSWEKDHQDVWLRRNTFTKLSVPSPLPHVSVQAGDDNTTCSEIRLIDPKYAGAATPAIKFVGRQMKSIEYWQSTETRQRTVSQTGKEKPVEVIEVK